MVSRSRPSTTTRSETPSGSISAAVAFLDHRAAILDEISAYREAEGDVTYWSAGGCRQLAEALVSIAGGCLIATIIDDYPASPHEVQAYRDQYGPRWKPRAIDHVYACIDDVVIDDRGATYPTGSTITYHLGRTAAIDRMIGPSPDYDGSVERLLRTAIGRYMPAPSTL